MTISARDEDPACSWVDREATRCKARVPSRSKVDGFKVCDITIRSSAQTHHCCILAHTLKIGRW